MVKVTIICSIHGIFHQTPNHHLNGKGCKSCGRLNNISVIKSTTSKFIKKAIEVHKNLYTYENVEYVNSRTKVNITCKKHGTYECTPNNHLRGKGCPICKFSKGELEILNWLTFNNISYIHQYKFTDCKNKRPLPFDFYLPEHNTCIEFDGKQHFKIPERSKDKLKNEEEFVNIKLRDKIKDEYCNDNNIHLLRIPYNEISNISYILKTYIH